MNEGKGENPSLLSGQFNSLNKFNDKHDFYISCKSWSSTFHKKMFDKFILFLITKFEMTCHVFVFLSKLRVAITKTKAWSFICANMEN